MKTDYELDELALDAEIQEGEHTGSKAKDVFCKQWDQATKLGERNEIINFVHNQN